MDNESEKHGEAQESTSISIKREVGTSNPSMIEPKRRVESGLRAVGPAILLKWKRRAYSVEGIMEVCVRIRQTSAGCWSCGSGWSWNSICCFSAYSAH